MIRLHHLNDSRSQRILWLLEELGLEYEIVSYVRNKDTSLAPPELKKIHPLGKSPVLEDGGKIIAESGTIIEYLIDTHGKGDFKPTVGTDDYWRYNHFLHFAEGSAILPVMLMMYTSRLGEAAAPLQPRIQEQLASHFGYLESEIGSKDFLVGDDLTGADIQIAFVLEGPKAFGLIADYPNLCRYVDKLQSRNAYLRALEKGGAYAYGPQG